MASTLKLVCALFLLCLIEKGYCHCESGEFTIAQAKTGAVVSSRPEFRVTISNKCSCTQLHVTLSCDGFQSVKPVGGLTKTGSSCLVNNGQPIYAQNTFTFTYAWDAAFPFKPLSSSVACS
ncbi:putative Beta-1 3-N-Acetylglucosaminyltransferase family protein [Tripterygium wilfordii]|uniref:Putative Beta-1 3-N-Acetylglucosaminyltransferase family protein n=1 Tax=Tripterygium wilfordii TaxID=458696 RepID=A0A7J7DP91_TRIWF|nr:uncharacterized protein At1g05835-like [Tripterygium wilfordii]KAF5748127.1 putative Beta-1 3-N-Acetylglucosaminyltransferase family protein [Tripterygium wilfordii]